MDGQAASHGARHQLLPCKECVLQSQTADCIWQCPSGLDSMRGPGKSGGAIMQCEEGALVYCSGYSNLHVP